MQSARRAWEAHAAQQGQVAQEWEAYAQGVEAQHAALEGELEEVKRRLRAIDTGEGGAQ